MLPDGRPVLLDTYCKAGGATRGYQQAGFYVVGVDIEPQPRYCGDELIQADALEVLADRLFMARFDAVHASPPCQAFSAGPRMWSGRLPDGRHPDLIEPTRARLSSTALPYVIENVEGAPLLGAITLCGSSFGLGVRRHRLFETSFFVWAPPTCVPGHPRYTVSVFGGGALSRTPPGGWTAGAGNFLQRRVHVPHEQASVAMGIDWMSRNELSQAIPPAYTAYMGGILRAELAGNRPLIEAGQAETGR